MVVVGTAVVILPVYRSALSRPSCTAAFPISPTVANVRCPLPHLPAFYIALTVGLGTAIKSTAGVAGAAFAVMFVPQVLGGLLPIVGELSPTSIGVWALATAKGDPASILTLVGWLVSMTIIVVGAKLVFDRQEF